MPNNIGSKLLKIKLNSKTAIKNIIPHNNIGKNIKLTKLTEIKNNPNIIHTLNLQY